MTHRLSQGRGSAPSNRMRIAGTTILRGAHAALRFAVRQPVIVLASVAVLGGASVFAWNATMTQTGRHPAPLFAGQKPAAAKAEARPEPQKRAEPASPLTTGTTRIDTPTPPPRPSGPDAIGSIIRTTEGPARPEPKGVDTRAKSAEAKPKPAEPKPAAVTKKPADTKVVQADAKAKAEPRVASAQKALAKLGYGPIQADGLLGGNTRAALERFERDKKLPVTGTLGTRTTKQLASLSGISVQ